MGSLKEVENESERARVEGKIGNEFMRIIHSIKTCKLHLNFERVRIVEERKREISRFLRLLDSLSIFDATANVGSILVDYINFSVCIKRFNQIKKNCKRNT